MNSRAPIVDTHLHLWDLERLHYPWLTQPPPGAMFGGTYDKIRRTHRIEEFLPAYRSQNVVKAVHVEACCLPVEAVQETQMLHAIGERHGYPHGIVGYADLRWPDIAAKLEAHLTASPRFRGIRMMNRRVGELKAADDRATPMSDPAWQRGLDVLTRLGLSFDLQSPPPFMDEAAQVFARNPNTNVIVTHCGIPLDRSPAGIESWRRGMKKLAALPNLAVKISALATSDHHWTIESFRPFVLECIEYFGADRAFFASNWPVDSLYGSFDAIFDAYRSIIAGFSEAEQRKLLHDNACRIYRV